MYHALGKTRTTLSPLRIVHRIVAACAQDAVDNWIEAWRAIKLLELWRSR
jgi:hypothetical protein